MKKDIVIDKFGCISINAKGTRYDSIRYNPSTNQIIFQLKYSRANTPPEPYESCLEWLMRDIIDDKEDFPQATHEKEIILKRIEIIKKNILKSA